MGARAESIEVLRGLLREHFATRYRGALHPRASRLQGHVDGYMDALLRSGAVSQGMFPEDWPRYVLKMATGAGKTKVMSLLIAWSYFPPL